MKLSAWTSTGRRSTAISAALLGRFRPTRCTWAMKRILLLIFVVLLVVAGVFAGPKAKQHFEKRNKPKYTTVKVSRGDIIDEVLATGTIDPVLKVDIGSFVSGPIVEIKVDFNEKVTEGQLLARVDPRRFRIAKLRDEATLNTARARVLQTRTELQRAINDERRAMRLRDINEDYLADTEMDQFKFARQSLEAQLVVAEENVKQAEAQLSDSKLNLIYTDILAPMAGTIIDRKIDEGQTLAAQFQTPSLFTLAPDMEKRMWVLANVVEADIGRVIKAKTEDRPVYFTVDAYEDELFVGKIFQIRRNPLAEQSVVTYPVVVETPNPGEKLLPGMTADLSFEIERREDVLRIPAEAIRFLPEKTEHVREEDKHLIEGDDDEDDEIDEDEPNSSAVDRVEAIRERRKRHVWVQEGEKLKAIEIEFGDSSGGYYELVEGELSEGQELVVDIE